MNVGCYGGTQTSMDDEIYLPRLSEFTDDLDEWSYAAAGNYRLALRECVEKNDQARRESLLQDLRADVNQALKSNLKVYAVVLLLAKNTTDTEEHLRLYTAAANLCSANLPGDAHFIEMAELTFKAGRLLREVGLLQEKKGNFTEAEKYFTRAFAHLQDASDLFETHCLSEDRDTPEGETFPLRPRLLAELKRVRKHQAT